MYTSVVKLFQKLKIVVLCDDLVVESTKRKFFAHIKLQESIEQKRIFFNTLQAILTRLSYLVYVDSTKQIYIDLDVNKKFDINVIIYYVKLAT